MIKSSKLKISIVGLIVVIFFVFYLFGGTGVRTILGMLLVFFIPFYLILNNFDLEQDEKVFFSFFIGLALYTVLVWYVNRVIPSMRISMLVTFLLLVFIGLMLKYLKKKKSKT